MMELILSGVAIIVMLLTAAMLVCRQIDKDLKIYEENA
jgi:hypothetical protein